MFFSMGVFFALLPTEIFETIAEYADYDLTKSLKAPREPDHLVTYAIALVPILISLLRMQLFRMIGEIELPSGSAKYTDDGLYEMDLA
mmetsp:Transcript_21705/g.18702  ORF Transcript_21705/g.18702 Transcript_21705/m.18702 type:complete len:88 (+) Transcript_21705:491-754(+)